MHNELESFLCVKLSERPFRQPKSMHSGAWKEEGIPPGGDLKTAPPSE